MFKRKVTQFSIKNNLSLVQYIYYKLIEKSRILIDLCSGIRCRKWNFFFLICTVYCALLYYHKEYIYIYSLSVWTYLVLYTGGHPSDGKYVDAMVVTTLEVRRSSAYSKNASNSFIGEGGKENLWQILTYRRSAKYHFTYNRWLKKTGHWIYMTLEIFLPPFFFLRKLRTK